jgi:hypothetical protein
MRKNSLVIALPVLLVAFVLPLQADSVQPDCFNVTSSLASTVRGPTVGDEQFFTLPSGPSNIMFVLDSSGSMAELPQCGDGNWGDNGSPRCTYPLSSGSTTAGRVKYPAHASSSDTVGTCAVSGDTYLSWMLGYVPVVADGPYDKGHGTSSAGLIDQPSWGFTCTNDNCMFRSDRVYRYGTWTETTATSQANCARDGGSPLSSAAEAACQSCLATRGFYFLEEGRDNPTQWVVFSGAWLNKNPPKFMAARKVIKDMVWMNPATPSPLDRVRFGVAILALVGDHSTGDARIVVPLGPDMTNSFPANATRFTEARQYMLNAMNRTISGLPSFRSGSTPMATTLFGVGQYLSSPGTYAAAFGSAFEKSSLAQSSAGAVNAPWAQSNPNQCSICWGCQQNSIIIVTDGSPNSEATLPSVFDSYDQSVYTSAANCASSTCTSNTTPSCPSATNVNATVVRSTTAALASVVGTPASPLHPSYQCNAANTMCRCRDNTNTNNPLIPRTENCYTCPGSTTRRPPTYACGYTCPGETTPVHSSNNDVCWYYCPGAPSTHVTQGTVCSTTCGSDPAVHPVGYTCPCSCPGDPNPYTSSQTCPHSLCCSPTDSDTSSKLPRIAAWLKQNDLRDPGFSGRQVASTYTVSFGIPVPALPDINPAVRILEATAHMGGGLFNNASDATSLASAVSTAVNAVVERANSFSAPAAASLSTLRSVAVEAVLTRFKPNGTPNWEGHVYQGMLFDEFLNGCDSTKLPGAAFQPSVTCGTKTNVSANFNGDALPNGNANCSGVFLVDADCDEVEEDNLGNFQKKGQGIPANLFWDAGFALSTQVYPAGHSRAGQAVPGYRSADDRNILSVVNGAVAPLTAANAATFAPYMNLSTAWCAPKLQLWGICGTTPLPACTSVVNQCAEAIINFVRGWDLLDGDSDSCGAPGRYSNATSCPNGADGEQRDRANDNRTASPSFWKLGDVFHSAPVLVRAPPDEYSCATGFENQCTATIFSPPSLPKQTEMVRTYSGLGGLDVDAYEAYRLQNVDRQQLVLVGSNDGMLHAFDAGVVISGTRNVLGVLPHTRGTGEELWALVPPDLLPRLKDLTVDHQYMVDGNIMVKDVWVDGSTANPAVNHSRDNVKQYGSGQEEFHTVAVITERSGGTQYTALDITNVLSPKFLWSFPPPGSDDSRFMGQSWTDFAPGPPPIGPVRKALGSGVPDPTSRGFEEQWVVFVNGGYDPTLTRGRAVWMVDVWTGRVVWRYTDNDFKTDMGFTSGASMFPVTATVGAVDIGDPTQPTIDRDGFYDTATWGDLGGNLFVARFWKPGTEDISTRRVTNWFVGRAFEEQRQSTNVQSISGRSPFFFMADNVFDPTTHTLRTYLGSGNRARSMATGSECTPDNLMGCCAAGCTHVRATFSDAFGSSCTRGAEFRCDSGVLQLDRTTGDTCGSPLTCGSFTGTATLHLECPGASTLDVTGQITCDQDGICSTPTNLGTTSVANLASPTTKPRFYGVWSFGGPPTKRFDDTVVQARAFDANRFTDVSYSGCAGPTGGTCKLVDVTQANVNFTLANPLLSVASCASGTTCQATETDAGWYYEYGDRCPLGTCDPAPPWFDEKTGAPASTVLGCTSWASFRPVGAATSGTDPCAGDVGIPQSYGYMADYMTGVPTAACGYQYSAESTNAYLRATRRSTIAAPNAQTIRVVVSPTGEVKYQGIEFPPGATSGGMVAQTDYGTRTDTSEMIYWLEVPRDLHNCRHDAAASVSTCE